MFLLFTIVIMAIVIITVILIRNRTIVVVRIDFYNYLGGPPTQ